MPETTATIQQYHQHDIAELVEEDLPPLATSRCHQFICAALLSLLGCLSFAVAQRLPVPTAG
jgi:hypothetical protein